jgi:large subunit ribosomal protein L35
MRKGRIFLCTFAVCQSILLRHMPKLKSHSGAKKRVKKTGSGRITIKRGRRNHLLLQKSKRQKRLDRKLVVSRSECKSLKSLLPHL